MKKIIILFAVAALFSACKTGKNISGSRQIGDGIEVSSPHDGLSYENAVVIKDKSETTGVAAEYTWIRNHYPGSSFGKQSLTNNKGKPYDIIDITTADGQQKSIYFDISNFYGKF